MTRRRKRSQPSLAELDSLIDEITTDAYGEDEQLWAFRQAFEDEVTLPMDAFVIGEPVSVIAIDYDGNERRGLTATCRRPDGSEHVVAASEVVFDNETEGARLVSAYRKWQGLDPAPADTPHPSQPPKRHKAQGADLDLDSPFDLVVLASKDRAARCLVPGTKREITLRSADVWNAIPGEIITVRGRKQWIYAGHPYLSGDITEHRLDVASLGLTPLQLLDEHPWDPDEEYWGEEDEPLEDWAEAIIARGPRPSFEMERVVPGEDPDDWERDPIVESGELALAGDRAGARKLLMELLATDLRCLDAHAHLGNLVFDHQPEEAVRHYEVGVRIGELSLAESFDGVLPWGRIDNRPFLRCMHGYGLCLWRLGRFQETEALFERMLWLNPSDNQGIRFMLPQVRAGERWEDHVGDDY